MTYTDKEQNILKALVEVIIPASPEYNVPGAGDEIIMNDILDVAAPHHDTISIALGMLEELAGGLAFADLPDNERSAAAETFKAAQPAIAGLITILTAQCYYRDNRVMHSLEMEARPPFPKGFEVAQGDWSLLDPVRARDKFYREV